MKTPYDVLDVPRNASNERIRTAFRKAAKACHPDLNADDPSVEQKIRQVIAAYEILKSPHKRAAYDRHLHACRRAKVRQFAGSAVASLGGILVAFAISLAAWQSNTQVASAAQPTAYVLSAKVSPDTSPQADAGRQEANRTRKSDRDGAPDHGARDRRQAASSVLPTAAPPWLHAALATELRLQAGAGPLAFADRTRNTELARTEPISRNDSAAPPSSNSRKEHSLEERATKFVSSQIAGRSSTNTSDLGSLVSAYADNVLYYGNRKSRQAILLEKRRDLERSPARTYDVQRDSMTVKCVANVCKVSGTMAWKKRNAHRTTLASGMSKFDYEITPSGDGFRILSENGSVVKRSRQADGRNHGPRTQVSAYSQMCDQPIASNESRNPFGPRCTLRRKS